MKPETRRLRAIKRMEKDIQASMLLAGTKRICPLCLKEITINMGGTYRKHTSSFPGQPPVCPVSGRYVVHNGVIL